MGYAEERALIGEIVIILILNNRRQQKKSEERRERKNEKTKYAAIICRAAENHLGRIAKPLTKSANVRAGIFAHSTSNRWQ
jgi:hypothetical protein